MLDFVIVTTRVRNRVTEIYPKFIIKKSTDLMIRGGDFYAIWIEDRKMWSTDEQDAIDLIDYELDKFKKENIDKFEGPVHVLHLWDAETGMINHWHDYVKKQKRDQYHILDEQLIFANTVPRKENYASKRLPYALEPCDTPAWDKLIGTLYNEEERHKIEWCIGSIVSGDSVHLQKFMVLYGAAGTGKSTILNVIQQLFDGYYSVFDAKALGNANSTFALESFKTNPLVAIQHDGDLSHIEDNTRLNSLVSHELMTVNEKFKSTYSNRFNAFLFMGTNKPVKITDAKSGLIRRLIDVSPNGNKLSLKEYNDAVKHIAFELGGIASKCRDIYLEDPNAYDEYVPLDMLGATNDFYNFVIDSYYTFQKEDGVTLKSAWELYKIFCEEAKVNYPFSQRVFKEELRNYFRDFEDRHITASGERVRSYYSGFRTDKFEIKKPKAKSKTKGLELSRMPSLFDGLCADCPAQLASDSGTPMMKWDNVKTTLKDIDTSKIHYVKVPENHIVIDFDIPDENGEKSLERNMEEASKWPPTYAELSKSGAGVHLHYIYTGDVSRLSKVYADHIEIKVFTGGSSLRRRLTCCNDIPIATISSGLPTKGEEKVVNFDTVQSEKGLRALIQKNLAKEVHSSTKCSMDFIYKILEDAYASGMHYDVNDLYPDIFMFAANSTHQADYCMKLLQKMKLASADVKDIPKSDTDSEMPSEFLKGVDDGIEKNLVFFDVECYPNLFLICYKKRGKGQKKIRLYNPTPMDIEPLLKKPLVGFNNRKYDNHMVYAAYLGYSNAQLFDLSQRLVSSHDYNAMFREAYGISYTDIYDFSAEKKSLKAWEIELGIHHQEMDIPWDQPVPLEMWPKVGDYCCNDVDASEAVFDHLSADWLARKILTKVASKFSKRASVNDTTNTLTAKIIFGDEKNPQTEFEYRNMGDMTEIDEDAAIVSEHGKIFDHFVDDEFVKFRKDGKPIFPGYKFEAGVSTYRGEVIGEGGYVYAEPGMYGNVALLDIASMHPSSAIAEEFFGPRYTKQYKELKYARVHVKHKDFKKLDDVLGGALVEFITPDISSKDLAYALKIAINAVYGETFAKHANRFRIETNRDNLIAKRGALFMVNLKHEVQKRGFVVAHIKTDSIKIPDATPEIIQFVKDFGEMYGYDFEHEATYDRMCLVNDSVYIAKYKDGEEAGKWTATGTQFAVPYVFKTLFSHEDIVFGDLCETKSVQTTLYLDKNEEYPDVTMEEAEKDNLKSKIRKALSDDAKRKRGETVKPSKFTLQDIPAAQDRIAELDKVIETGHNYRFVGRIGQFCPLKNGCGGGYLMRQAVKDGKICYDSATGANGYRWMETEEVKLLGKEKDIDRSYYIALVDKAVDTIKQYGDFEWFVSDDPYVSPTKVA